MDIGCGTFPYFLSYTSFQEKFAVDKQSPSQILADIQWHTLNLDVEPYLPFEDSYFSCITLLAVIEHLDPINLVSLLAEVYRVLHPGGVLILTTPAAWSDGILKRMARWNLVSAEEINEHKFAYTLPLLGWYFGKAGFEMRKVKFGYFEWMFNLWAVAER